MLFTKGKLRSTERIMMERPGVERKRQKVFFATADNKDCPHCLYYAAKERRCKYDHCVVFE